MSLPAERAGARRSRAHLGPALGRLVAEAAEYARLRTRPVVRATLKRVTDEAALVIPTELRQRIDRALASPDATVPLLRWIGLLAESRRALEGDLVDRTARLREAVRRSGALLDSRVLEKALAALSEDPAGVPDLGAVLDRRRAAVLVQSEIEGREEKTRRRWQDARAEVAAVVGPEAAQAAEAALAGGDSLPALEALDEIDARRARQTAAPDPLSSARAELGRALDASQDFLSPQERDWARRALATCPESQAAAADSAAATGDSATAAWIETLGEVRRWLDQVVAGRKAAIERLERCFGQAGAPPVGTGYARLCLLIEALGQRRAVAEGRRDAAGRQCLAAEWDLSRAVWDDGPWAGASSLLEARRAFFECHSARELPDTEAVLGVARRTAHAAARVRIEASWRRRWLLRHGRAGAEERQRELRRIGERVAVQIQSATDEEVEARCREAEARLWISLAALCAQSGPADPPDEDAASVARSALESGEPGRLEQVLGSVQI